MTETRAPRADGPTAVAPGAGLTVEERIEIVLTAACELHRNGQETEETLRAAGRLSRALGLTTTLFLQWGELSLQADTADGRARVRTRSSLPATWTMDRVVAVTGVVDAVSGGRLAPADARHALAAAAEAPPSSLPLLVAASALGAVALSVINGAADGRALALIAVTAGVGAVLRRSLERHGGGPLLQVLVAAALAGLVGAWALHVGLGPPMGLVALGPCLVLMPGPAVLNGAFDLVALRILLGAARLGFAVLVIATISVGVVVGLAAGAATVPPPAPSASAPLGPDLAAAGVAAAAYSVFYSTPRRMIGWPVAVGVAAHAVRWWALSVPGLPVALATGLGCLVAGTVLTPVSHRRHLPFAAVGFASVVAMIPGASLIRVASGLVQLQTASAPVPAVASGVVSEGMTALVVLLAIVLGLVLPQRVHRGLEALRARRA